MGQILRADSIADMSITGAKTLELPASVLTIGGQQYTTTIATALDMTVSGAGGLDTGAIAASTTYYVYAIRDAGLVKLTASLSASAPTGFTAYKQVGALFTDATPDISTVGSNTDLVSSVTPGTIQANTGSEIPFGYLECDGTAVSRTTYANLFAKVGTTYGVGDGSTTFNLPIIASESFTGWPEYTDADVTITSATTGFSVNDSFFTPYQVTNGSWRCNIALDCNRSAAATNATISMVGILFRNTGGTAYQGLSGYETSTSSQYWTSVTPNTDNIQFIATGTYNIMCATGDVALESKPSWAATPTPAIIKT